MTRPPLIVTVPPCVLTGLTAVIAKVSPSASVANFCSLETAMLLVPPVTALRVATRATGGLSTTKVWLTSANAPSTSKTRSVTVCGPDAAGALKLAEAAGP